MRADRLLSLMLMLHARGRMTADQLAAHLEVSERTVYRDIAALGAAGVPVYTQSGAGGGVFLDENYRVSLTGLTPAEVRSLFMAGDAGPLADLGLQKAVEDTLLKLFAALPSRQRHEVERLRQRFYIDPANWFQVIEASSVFPALQQAVWEDCCISVLYHPVEGGPVEYTLEAYALVAKANIWYLVGRKPDGDIHNYRIARFEHVTLTGAHFERDPGFDLAAYWKESCRVFEQTMMRAFPRYPAALRVHPDLLWYFPGFMAGKYEQTFPPDADGWTRLDVIFDSQGDARARILGLGDGVEVLEPPALRQAIIETAAAVLRFYQRR